MRRDGFPLVIITSDFSPVWFLRNPHLQTIAASRYVVPPAPDVRHERHDLDDGDFVDLAVGDDRGGAIVAILHGLAGCHASSYARGAFATLSAAGLTPILMHWRGCSGEPNRLRRSYHSGATDDPAWFFRHLQRRFEGRPLLALGFSLGGNALIKYLGERGDDTPLAAAMAVCPPLVLAEGARRLDRGVSRLYQRYLLGRLRAQHEAKRKRYPTLGLPSSAGLASFRRYDDSLTAPLHGFDGVDDYYTRCSARPYLARVRRPLHLLCARDDPFFTTAVLPEADELHPDTVVEISERGGHVGFLAAGARGGVRRWLDDRVATVLSALATAAAADSDEILIRDGSRDAVAPVRAAGRAGVRAGSPDRP